MANPQVAKVEPEKPADKTVTVVINNREGLEIIQMPYRGKDAHGRLMPGGEVILIPGLNLVDTDKVNVLMKNELFAAKFTTILPMLKGEEKHERAGQPILVKGPELPTKRPLSSLGDSDAVALVGEANEEQLRQFEADDLRDAVKRAIAARMKVLESKGESLTSEDF